MIPAAVGHQCPECVAEGRRTQRSAVSHFGGSAIGLQGYVTKALIAINVAVFLLGILFVGGKAAFNGGILGSATDLHYWGAVTGPSFALSQGTTVYTGIDDGAYYRLFTAMFLHYGLLHVGVNMWALWQLGRALEAVLGPWRFAALYLISGLGGNVAAYVFSPGALSAGASTALFGLFAAYFVVLKRLGRDTSSIVPVIVLNLVFTFGFSSYISIAGHLGGFVTGAILGLGLAYAPRQNRTMVQVATLVGTFLALMALTIFVHLSR